jgi:hypothetical protein
MKPTHYWRGLPVLAGPLVLMLFVLTALASPAFQSQVTRDWVDTHSGLHGIAVAVDGQGNSYVTGPSLQDAAHKYNEDIILIKYDAAGNRLWTREFDETGDATSGSDVSSWLTLDPAGNIIVTGRSFLFGWGARFVTLKYDANGNLLWKARPTVGYEGKRVATDAAGNIYVAGVTSSSNSADYLTIKYDPNGVQLWAKTYNGPANFREELNSLAVSPTGKAVVTGRSADGGYDVATVLYDSNGNQLWVRRYDAANGGDAGYDVAFGPGGEVYVGGYAQLTELIDMLLLKYSPAGNLAWVRTINGPDNMSDSIARIGIDGQGNVVAAGYIQPASFYSDMATLKYAPNGSQLWLRLYDGPIANDEEIPSALAIGPGNSVYVTGNGYGPDGAGVLTVKYDAAGNQVWSDTYNDPDIFPHRGMAIAVDALGNATVTGTSPILTIHYSESGGPVPTPIATISPTPTAKPDECALKCLRSKQIALSRTAAGVSGKVTVRDENGAAVRNASVTVIWTLPDGATRNQTATTTTKGIATFKVTGGAGPYTLTVNNIAKSGFTFDPANSLLSKSFVR